MPLCPVSLLVLGAALGVSLPGVCCGSSRHSLLYQYVAVSEPSEGLPQFFTVGFLDDQIITYYDSQMKTKIPKVTWMAQVEKEDASYWTDGSDILQATQQVMREDLRHVQNRYKQNEGFHTWQATCGCELKGNRSTRGYSQYGYDGRTFLTFNKESLSWTAPDPQAQITKRNWDANVKWSQRNKEYLEEECIEWLEKYLSYRMKEPSPETPVVTVSSRKEAEDGMETHICRLHGFYPKEIDATWRRDGEVWLEDTHHGFLAPNADGTYHYWLSIQIDPKERSRYRCHVEHDGLQEPLEVALKEPTSKLTLVICCIVATALALMFVIAVTLIFFKKYDGATKQQKQATKDPTAQTRERSSSFSSLIAA